jgi:hypothetical protein
LPSIPTGHPDRANRYRGSGQRQTQAQCFRGTCTVLVIEDPRRYERESGELRICDEFLQQCEQAELLPDQRWVQLISLTRPGLEVEPMWWDRLWACTIVAPGAAAVELGLQIARAVVS